MANGRNMDAADMGMSEEDIAQEQYYAQMGDYSCPNCGREYSSVDDADNYDGATAQCVCTDEFERIPMDAQGINSLDYDESSFDDEEREI